MTGSPSGSIEQFVVDGRLRSQRADAQMLGQMVDAARDDVRAADAMEHESASWAEAILYEAGLRCARVIVQAAGWRISTERGHQTAIDAADALTGGLFHKRLLRLHRMRRMRHEFMYEVGPEPSRSDIVQARRDVQELIAEAQSAVDALGSVSRS